MRTIKFRGKRLDDNRWIYGDLMRHQDGDTFIGDNTHYWTDDGYHNNEYEEVRAVEDDTVGQYTGIKDATGREIYEDDIVRLSFNKSPYLNCEAYVAYDQGEWVCKSLLLKYVPSQCLLFFGYKAGLYKIEVIGNIHDNPELMKGGAE